MSDKKRIAFLCHPYHRGGVTRWMADAALAAAADGHEVYFITVDPVKPFYSGKGREKMIDLLKGSQVQIISCGVDYFHEFGTPKLRAGTYSFLIKKNLPLNTPIIVSDDASVWAAAGSVADKYPMIGVMHGNDDIYFSLARKYAKQLSACICVSGRIMKNLLAGSREIDPAKVSIIPCGIRLPEFAPASGDKILKLIFIGRIEDKVKRATDLVSIAALLHKKGIESHLSIVGNGKEAESEYLNLFKNQGVAQFVTFHGWMEKSQIQGILNQSDILLLTSNSEGMPLVMMEALASGCGFTGTRVSGIEDYENDPRAKDCFSVYTIGDIEDAVNKIMSIAGVAKATRQLAARKLAESAFGMDVCLDRYFTLTDQIQGPALPFTIKISLFDRLLSNIMAVARHLKVGFRNKN